MLIFSILAVGCASGGGLADSNRLPNLKETGQLAQDEGVIIVSAGRVKRPCEECNALRSGNLPFVSYRIYRYLGPDAYELVGFIAAESGVFSQLDKENYGFIHYRELLEGHYILHGVRGRSANPGLVAPIGGIPVFLPESEDDTRIAYEFEVVPGKLNYLGELLTFDGLLKSSSVRLSRNADRDVSFVVEKHQSLEPYELVDTVLVPIAVPTFSAGNEE